MKWLLWPAVLACTAWLYSPGLSGGFRLDDSINLAGLSRIDPGAPLEGILSYVLQGFAGPSGRPLSLLSFALQYEDWPNNPRAFLYANLLIHLINSTLVLMIGWLASRHRVADARMRFWIAMGAAALWAVWPIQSSTVLYVVQRMAMLATTSMLLGMLLYLVAREYFDRGQRLEAHALFASAWLIGLPIGILCKETAIAFPLTVMALDMLRPKDGQHLERSVGWTLLLSAPLVAFATYLLIDPAPLSGYAVRDFSMWERVLTQPRVLWMYVAQAVAPGQEAFQFSYDGLDVSRSLFQPASTSFAVAAWAALVVMAIHFRKRHPVLAFAVTFFLASHALESSILPLEIAFEHRNYLASFGLAFGISYAFAEAIRLRAGRLLANALAVSGGLYFTWVVWTSYGLHRLWGNELAMAMYQYDRQPHSLRAVTGLSEALKHAGNWRGAAAVLRQAELDFPEDPVFPLLTVEVGCAQVEPNASSLERAISKVATATTNTLSAFAAIDRLSITVEDGNCPRYSPADLLMVVRAAESNPAMQRFQPDLLLIAGRLHAAMGDTDSARSLLRESINLRAKPDVICQAAAWELAQGNLGEAKRYITMLGPEGPLSWRQRVAVAGDREKLEMWFKSAQPR